jgi:GNAT superfamily N-acetyltransferase
MVEIINHCNAVDGNEWVITAEELENGFRHEKNRDPYQDMVFAEIHGAIIGYGSCRWEVQLDGIRNYFHFARLQPEWRGKGIDRAMLQFNETRLRQIANSHPSDSVKFFTSLASERESQWAELLQSAEYQPIRYYMRMVRPSLDNIPDLPLPDGIAVRRGTHAEWRQIWEAAREAFKDNWGEEEWTEEDFHAWNGQPYFNPTLFQIGWDGDEVAGGVLGYIDEPENEAYGRLRGYTEGIFVRSPWRKRGLAKALIARSLQLFKEIGMSEAGLTVDAENTTGAVKLYTDMGFQKSKVTTSYRKPL